MTDTLSQLLQQETELQFARFNEDDAWTLGRILAEKARVENLPVAIDISVKDRTLFYYACKGSSPDNQHWINRKKKTVNRFGHSSLYVGRRLFEADTTIEKKYLLSEQEYAAHGGSFPIVIIDVGVIGTITVSGLAQKDDHAMVIAAIEEYQQQE